MTEAILGIDVSKDTLDTNIRVGAKSRSKTFANSLEGWCHLVAWLKEQKIYQVHACLEATGRYSLGVALALHEAGHIVSIVNPAQIRDFARTKLGRNKTHRATAWRRSPGKHPLERGAAVKPRSPSGARGSARA